MLIFFVAIIFREIYNTYINSGKIFLRKEGLTMKTHIGKEKWNRAAALYVRMNVFVMERGIPLKEEFDSEDHDETIYVVIYDGERPVTTGRYKQIDSDTIRPGRIAVLKEYRKKGLGEVVVKELEALGKKLGYTKESDVYYEDGVPCVTLNKELV